MMMQLTLSLEDKVTKIRFRNIHVLADKWMSTVGSIMCRTRTSISQFHRENAIDSSLTRHQAILHHNICLAEGLEEGRDDRIARLFARKLQCWHQDWAAAGLSDCWPNPTVSLATDGRLPPKYCVTLHSVLWGASMATCELDCQHNWFLPDCLETWKVKKMLCYNIYKGRPSKS